MTELNPPLHLQNRVDHSAQGDRLLLRSLWRNGGVASYNDLLVTAQAAPNMTVSVAAGTAIVPGTQNAHQGTYHCYNDGTVTRTIAAADLSLPRVDIIVARIKDQFYSGVDNQWEIAPITGTPNATPSAPSAPANSIVLATINVGANVSTITSANITNLQSTTGPARMSQSRYQLPHASDVYRWFGSSGAVLAELDQTGHYKSFGTTGGPTKIRKPMARAQSGAMTVPNQVSFKMPYISGSVVYDTDGMHDNTNTWFQINTPGIYTVRTSIAFAHSNSVGYRAVGIVKNNGTEIVRSGDDAAGTSGLASDRFCQITLPCNQGDTFYSRAWQNSGASLQLATAVQGYVNSTYLEIEWKAPLT